MALAWITERPGVTTAVIGARKTHQLKDNLAAAQLELADDEIAAIEKASRPELIYPTGINRRPPAIVSARPIRYYTPGMPKTEALYSRAKPVMASPSAENRRLSVQSVSRLIRARGN